MLIAIKEGSGIIATEANKGCQYFCPECNEEVVLKKGKVITHHFSHKTNTECPNAKSESKEHLRAKILIYNWCREEGMRCYLEHPISTPNGKRRADIYVENNGNKYAIEVQKSPQDQEVFEKRTESYRSVSIHVIWVPMLTATQNLASWHVWAILAHNNRCWFWDPEEEGFWLPNIVTTARKGKPMFDWMGVHKRTKVYNLSQLGLKSEYSYSLDVRIHKPHSPGSKTMRTQLIEGIIGSFYIRKSDDYDMASLDLEGYERHKPISVNNAEFVISYWSDDHSILVFDWSAPYIEMIRTYEAALSVSKEVTLQLIGDEIRPVRFILDKKIGSAFIHTLHDGGNKLHTL